MPRPSLCLGALSLFLTLPAVSQAGTSCSNAVLTGGGDLSGCTGPSITTGAGSVVFEPLPFTASDRSVRDLSFGASERALDQSGDARWIGTFYAGGRFVDTEPRPDATENALGLVAGMTFGAGFSGYLSFGQSQLSITEDNGDVTTRTALVGLTYATQFAGVDLATALYGGQTMTTLSGGGAGEADYTGQTIGLTIRGRADIWQISEDQALDLVVQGDISRVTAEGYDVDDLQASIEARSSTAMALRAELGMPMEIAAGSVRPFVAFTKWGGQQDDFDARAFGGRTTFRAADLYGTHQGTLGMSFVLAETGLSGMARYSYDVNSDSLLNVSLGWAF